MDLQLKAKLIKLEDLIRGYEKVTVAFSGGVDSTLLSYIAKKVLKDDLTCITISDEFHSIKEIEEAEEFTRSYGIKHIVLKTDYINSEIFKKNPKDRCYHCKKMVFSEIINKAGDNVVVDGTNADDVFDYRPGLRALEELGVKSPLKEAGLSKKDIYSLANEYKLKIKDKPSLACLATRIPFGEPVTKNKVRKIDEAETYIRSLGFYDVRVRYFEDTARIEIGHDEFFRIDSISIDKISKKLKEIGFVHILLDLEGYRRGSMNDG